MSDKDKKPIQKTPTGHEIPVPSRKDFMENLEKAAKPKPKESRPRRPKK